MHQKQQPLTSLRLVLFVIFLSIIVLLLLVFSQRDSIKQFMLKNKLLPLPETFTELYFENHTKLPNSIKPNGQISFTFTIHNEENKKMTYPYEVYLDEGNEKQLIEKKNVSLKNNGEITIPESFVITNPATRSAVVVNLINKKQQIDFWIKNR